jgi:hypothetical protein
MILNFRYIASFEGHGLKHVQKMDDRFAGLLLQEI